MYILSTLGGGAIIESLGGESQAVIVIGALLGLAYAILNSYYPNNFKFLNNNKKEICNCNAEILNEEYIYEEAE